MSVLFIISNIPIHFRLPPSFRRIWLIDHTTEIDAYQGITTLILQAPGFRKWITSPVSWQLCPESKMDHRNDVKGCLIRRLSLWQPVGLSNPGIQDFYLKGFGEKGLSA